MGEPKVERGSCRFKAMKSADGKPIIRLELFHQTVSLLNDLTVDFELLSGSNLEQARALADSANDRIIGVVVTKT